MLSRTRLWTRAAAPWGWIFPWAMIPACVLPWVLPEGWDGHLPSWAMGAAMVLMLASAPLIRFRRWAVVPLAVVIGMGTLGRLSGAARAHAARPQGLQAFEGVLTEPWTLEGDRWRSAVALSAPDPWAGTTLPLSLPADATAPKPAPGTPLRFRAEPQCVDPAPQFLAERPWWKALGEGAPARLHVASAALLESTGPASPSWGMRLKGFARARFEALPLDPLARDLWGAMALGIPPVHDESFAPFAESGTLHVLVVSGLQVSLIMGLAGAFARRIFGRGGTVTAALAGLAFAAIVGWTAPVWRGLLMGGALALGQGRGWRLPPVLGLHGALLVWLLGHPASGADPGFLLAWWALLGVLWGAEPLAEFMAPLIGKTALPLARLLAPWAATLPLLALLYGAAPLWAVAANLLVLPVVAVLTPLCLLLTLLPIPSAVAGVGAFLGWVGGGLVPAFSRVVPLGTGALWPWLTLIFGWLLLAHRQAAFRRTRALSLLLLAATAFLLAQGGTGAPVSSLTLEAFDVGQGDALLLRVPGGEALLVDTGPSPWTGRRLARALSRRGVREPVRLVLTHPHGDHAGGAATLLRLRPFTAVHVPEMAERKEAWAPWLSAPSEALRRGDLWRSGAAEISVRWPPKPFQLPDANMVSLVLRVRWQDRELWLMGDALAVQEADLLALGDPGQASFHRLLKAGHHGSRSSSDPQWIAAIDPELTLLTAGRRNRFGHPHAETLATLAGRSFEVVGPRRGVRVEAVAQGWRIEGGDGLSRTLPCLAAGR
jgi:competence protein ComEC